MSGQPYRYASDPERYRTEYLDSLGLRANIDNMNLQANKTYKLTGQLPPVSQMQETRTTSEILADNERLKIDIIKAMREVGDAQFAQAVIQRIQNSSLNTTGSLYTFFAQRIQAIIKNLKEQYRYGIKGDINDVETFASFVEDMFTKTKSMTSSVKGYFQQIHDGQKRSIHNPEDYDKIYTLFKDIARRLLLKSKPSSAIGKKCNKIAQGLRLYTEFLSMDTIDRIVMMIANEKSENFVVYENGKPTNKLDDFYDVFKRYNEIVEQFPAASTLYGLLQQLDQTIVNSDTALTNRLLTEFESLVSMINEVGDLIIELRRLGSTLNSFYNQPRDLDEEAASSPPQPQPTQPQPSQPLPFPYDQPLFPDETPSPSSTQQPLPFPYDQPLFPDEIPPNVKPESNEPSELSTDAKRKYVEDLQTKITELETKNAENYKSFNKVNDHLGLIIQRLNDNDYTDDKERKKLIKISKKSEKALEALRDSIEFTETTLTSMKEDLVQKLSELHEIDNPSGHGLRRRGRPKGCGVGKRTSYTESVKAHTAYDKGVMESPRFVKFGRYLVNSHKLNKDDILALKQPSGATLVDFPSVRISKNLSNVVKKMIGGGVPSYNELNGLSEPEKVYLHKISSKANILDKFSIPAPSKDQQEKDIHEFEVLKGEIMAGNDSKELIKKFKLHLIKLSKNGSLPKKEVAEIMEELLQLGF